MKSERVFVSMSGGATELLCLTILVIAWIDRHVIKRLVRIMRSFIGGQVRREKVLRPLHQL